MSEPAATDRRKDPYFLDANILMYAIGRDHPYKEPCIEVLHRIEEDTLRVVSNVEVLQEILHRYRSLGEYEVATSAFTQFKVLCDEILPLDAADVDRAFEILEDHREISVRDAIHAATMLRRGLEKILSTDTHFDAIEDVVRVDSLTLSRPPDHESGPSEPPDQSPDQPTSYRGGESARQPEQRKDGKNGSETSSEATPPETAPAAERRPS